MADYKQNPRIKEVVSALEQVPEDKTDAIIDFILNFTKKSIDNAKQRSSSTNEKLMDGWAGTLVNLNMTGLELQEEAKKLWGTVD